MRTNLAPRLMGIKYLRNHIDILTFLSFVLFPYNLGAKYQFQSVIQERLRHNKKWPWHHIAGQLIVYALLTLTSNFEIYM